jgi:hypothetical protein
VPVVEDAEVGDGGLGARGHCGVPDQPGVGGAQRDRVRRTGHLFAGGLIYVIAEHVDRAFIAAEHIFPAQRGLHCLVESRRVELVGQALGGARDESGGDLDAEQRVDQHRGALHRHVARTAQQDRGGVEVRPVGNGAGPPERRLRGRGGPAAAAAAARQQKMRALQHRRQHVPHLRPPIRQLHRVRQVATAVPALGRRVHPLGAVRVWCRCQSAALTSGLATRLAVLQAHPRRTIRPPLRLRRDRILRRRRRRVRRVPPEAPTQLGVLRLHHVQSRRQPLQQRTKLDYLSGKLLIGRTSTTGHPTMINTPVERSRRHAVTRQTPDQAHP